MNASKTHSDPPAPEELPEIARDAAEPPADAAIEPLAAAEPAGAVTPPAASGAESELRDRWLRSEAELQNYRRRAARDLEEARRAAEEAVYADLIECLDDLERALAAAVEAGADAAWRHGVELVAQRMRDVLARAGITRVPAEGQHFDPHLHEALLEVPAPEGAAPGAVVSVIRAGYRRGDRVLRPARVAVAAERAVDG